MHGNLPVTITHPTAIVGTTIINRPFQCSHIYRLGSSTPIANRPTAKTIRITSRVTTFELPDIEVHERGSNMFAAYGPIAMPNAVPKRTSFM